MLHIVPSLASSLNEILPPVPSRPVILSQPSLPELAPLNELTAEPAVEDAPDERPANAWSRTSGADDWLTRALAAEAEAGILDLTRHARALITDPTFLVANRELAACLMARGLASGRLWISDAIAVIGVERLVAGDAWPTVRDGIERAGAAASCETRTFLASLVELQVATGIATRREVEARFRDDDPAILAELSGNDLARVWGLATRGGVFEPGEVVRAVGLTAMPAAMLAAVAAEFGDRALVEPAAPSFETLVLPLRPDLVAYARRLCDGDADRAADVVQDAFAKAFRAWPRWVPEGDPIAAARGWMYRIVCNTFVKTYHHRNVRRRAARERREDLVAAAHGTDTALAIQYQDAGESRSPDIVAVTQPVRVDDKEPFGDEVLAAIAELDHDKREVVKRFYAWGQGCEEIARDLGIPKNTVHTRLARARMALAPVLAKFARTEYGYRGADATSGDVADEKAA
jgi:RNA polymerase sigma factor (sigma-70 family)